MSANWSPDGQWLSYIPPGSAQIEIYNLTDGRSHSIATRMSRSATWDPDGEAVLVVDLRGDDARALAHLLKFDLESGQMTDLTGEGTLEDAWAAWSPSGEWIALVRRDQSDTETSLGTQIWLMRPDGSEARPITSVSDIHHGKPVWSPDSRYLLLPWYPLGVAMAEPEIWRVDVETGNLALVTPGIQPTWLP
jgi:Tol biopolymer transport system component